ncbi:LysM peptidoglycan-binding domain-containing protein [Hymenobacter tenuis]
MIRYFLLFPVAALLLGVSAATLPADPKPTTEQLITRLTASIENLKTLRCNVRAKERIGSEYQLAQTSMKMTFKPYKVYLRNQKGIEVLYVTGQNDDDAWVYPNSFPYVTVSLDPLGSLMRKNQHHSVLDAGYGTIAELLRGSSNRLDHSFEKTFRYTSDTIVQGRPAHVLRANYPQFRYVSYKPSKPETVSSIAERFGCGEYRILEKNNLTTGATVPAGRTLQVPNAYGRKVTIVVDQKLTLPLVIQVNDDKGLFEKFEFSDIVANQPIPAQEFTKDFKGYKL